MQIEDCNNIHVWIYQIWMNEVTKQSKTSLQGDQMLK